MIQKKTRKGILKEATPTGAKRTNAKRANARHTNAKHTNAKRTNAKHANAKHGKTKRTKTKRTNAKRTRAKYTALWRRLLLGLLGVILGISIYLGNACGLLGNKLPMPFGYGAAAVLSGSMEPAFSKGDMIFVKEIDEIAIGDIVVYQSGHDLIVHRVVGLDGDQVTTQGDANNVPDAPFDKSDVIGVVIGWLPGGGVVVNILKTPMTTILIMIVAFLLIELSFRRQKDKDEKDLNAIKEEIRQLKKEIESED